MRWSPIVMLLPLALTSAPEIDSLYRRAEWLLFNRHLGQENLQQAYQLMARARQLAPSNENVLYLWARIHFQFGDNSSSPAEKLRWYERTKAISETLKTLNDHNPLGHLWWASACGRIGQLRGVMRSLFLVPALKREFTRTLELDPQNATAHAALGVLYYTLPAFAGGSLAKAEDHLRKALAIDPNYTLARLDLAKTYIKANRPAEARTQLELLLATKNPTIPADYCLDDRPEAEQLLRQLTGR